MAQWSVVCALLFVVAASAVSTDDEVLVAAGLIGLAVGISAWRRAPGTRQRRL